MIEEQTKLNVFYLGFIFKLNNLSKIYNYFRVVFNHQKALQFIHVMPDGFILGTHSYYHASFLLSAIGPVPSPFDCYLANRGLKTLHLRMRQHQVNAMAVARFLEKNSRVEKVVYPGKTAWVDSGGLARPLKIPEVKNKFSLFERAFRMVFLAPVLLLETQGGLYCDVAMGTLLAPVPFCFEPIIAICDSISPFLLFYSERFLKQA